jgi:hypothetical protein
MRKSFPFFTCSMGQVGTMHPGTSPPSVPSWRTSMSSSSYALMAARPVGTMTAPSIPPINTRPMLRWSVCNTWTGITAPGRTAFPGQSQE